MEELRGTQWQEDTYAGLEDLDLKLYSGIVMSVKSYLGRQAPARVQAVTPSPGTASANPAPAAKPAAVPVAESAAVPAVPAAEPAAAPAALAAEFAVVPVAEPATIPAAEPAAAPAALAAPVRRPRCRTCCCTRR